MKNLQQILNTIDYSKVVETSDEIPFYKEISEVVINYINNNDKATFQEITKYAAGSDRRTLRLLDQMVIAKVLIFKKPYFKLNNSTTKTKIKISELRCDLCDSKMVNISTNKDMKNLLVFMKKIIKARPIPTFVFDQRPVNAETTVRRVAYAQWRGDLQNKKIAIIGDDDLNSIALAKINVAKEIVVFDIDDRMLDYIDKVSKKYNLKIKTVRQDLLKEIPTKFLNYFDVFMTDPTPTPKPITLFTNWGVKMLSQKKGNVGYVSLYPSHMEKEIKFQQSLSKMEVLITDVIPFFNQYDFLSFTYTDSDKELLGKYGSNEDKISFWEYLMRIETTEHTHTLDLKISPLDLLGRATKRILKDPSKDPVLNKANSSKIIEDTAADLNKLLNKTK